MEICMTLAPAYRLCFDVNVNLVYDFVANYYFEIT